MFKSAHIKLTVWYLTIIMLISMFFSVGIYIGVSRELERGFQRTGLRFKAQELGIRLPKNLPQKLENLDPEIREALPPLLFVEDLVDAKRRLLFLLVYVNGVIFVFSGISGHFLAGKTLSPIEEAMEEQKRFVADASHELRTPLTAMKTSLEVALRDKKMKLKDAKNVIKESVDDVDSLESLASNLLTLANYKSGGKGLFFQKTELKEIVEKSVKKISPLAKKHGVKIKLDLKNIELTADESSLEKLVTILLDNAIKYTKKKGTINVSLKKKKRYALLKIKDDGIGISEKDLPNIFDRFYRADNSRCKQNIEGFGLGLSVAKEIVNCHKGTIDAKSKVNTGTTFNVKLPLG